MAQFKLPPNEFTSLLASTEASFLRSTPITLFISCPPISFLIPGLQAPVVLSPAYTPLLPPLHPAPEQWRGFITPPPPGTQSVCKRLSHIHRLIGTNVSLNRQHRQGSGKARLFQNELRSSVARRPGVRVRFPGRCLHPMECSCRNSPKATVPDGSRLWGGHRYRPYRVRGDPVARPTSADKQFLRACPQA